MHDSVAVPSHDTVGTFTEDELQTKLAMNVFKVVGICEQVTTLDACCSKLRRCSSVDNVRAYETALTNAQTKVLAAHNQLKKELDEWEVNHIQE